jgi:DNA-binding GntR family transcriptional regulator
MGVSKTPVREALIRLQRDGLVRIIPYRGASVARPSARDVASACEVREWLETRIARKLAEQQPGDVVERLRDNIRATERALADADDGGYVAAVRQFSELLLEASDNRYAQQILDNLRNFLGVIANASRSVAGRRERSIREHRAIYSAIKRGDADAAEAATSAHVRSILNDSLSALTESGDARDGHGH